MAHEVMAADNTSYPDEDDALIACFLGGEERGFEMLYRKYQGRFLATARRFLRDATEAEDVVQETFVAIYQGLPRFRHRAAFPTLAYQILVRKCLAYRQKQRRASH